MSAALLLFVTGAMACFAGYRLFRVVLALAGLVLGASAATTLMASSTSVTLIVVALAGGLVGAALLVAAYMLGVALLGAALGTAAAHVASVAGGQEPGVLIVVAFAAAGAVAAVFLERYVVVLATAFGGAWLLLLGVLSRIDERTAEAIASRDVWVLYPLDPVPGRGWVAPAWIVLGIVGCIVQLGWTAGERGRIAPRARRAT